MKMCKITLLMISILVFNLSCGEYDKRSEVKRIETSKNNYQIPNNQMNNASDNKSKDLFLDIDKIPLRTTIKGENLKLFLIAYDAFRSEAEIPENKKHIENYKIEIYESSEYFYVAFQPKIGNDEIPSDGGMTSLGKEVYYTIDKQTLIIKARFFTR